VAAWWLFAGSGEEGDRVGASPAAGLRAGGAAGAGSDAGRAVAPAATMFWVGDRPGSTGEWITANEGKELACRFADGASVLAKPGARLRVREDRAAETAVDVERGRIVVSVPHRDGAEWMFVVGPFAIRVTGTRFDTSWDPERGLFDLTMYDGTVVVTGPEPGTSRTVVAGQEFRWPAERGGRPGLPEPGTPSSPATTAGTAPTPVAQRDAGGGIDRAWQERAASGRYEEALARIETVGFDRIWATASAEDLLLLGDVMRLTGRREQAQRSYLTIRERYFDDPRKADAAFALGLLAFPAPASARWFETYLAETPAGPLAREALGRLVEVRQRMGDAAGALESARRYLEQYPDGPHAELARGIVAGSR